MKSNLLQCFGAFVAFGGALWAAACGARTDLLTPHGENANASEDAGADVVADAPNDVPDDGAREADAYKDDCTDPSIQYVYVVTSDHRLYSFRPESLAFAYIGTLGCPSYSTPFSMAVDRQGTAYVVYLDGYMYRVSTLDATCEATDFVPGTAGFDPFGMGFATDEGGPTEKLYVAASGVLGTTPQLGWIDTETYALQTVGPLVDSGMELTGTGDGRLFGFYQGWESAHLVRLDKQTAAYLEDTALPGVDVGSGWAFSFWGGDFWFFTAEGSYSTVTRYNPGTSDITVVADLPGEVIVGAGASTCAPEK